MEALQMGIILHWAAVILYSIAAVLFSVYTLFGQKRLFKYAVGLSIAGLMPHSAAILIRWIISGHGPYMLKYEVLSSNAWVTIVIYLLLAAKIKKIRFMGMIILPYSFLTMTFGLFADPAIKHLPPSLNSVWLVLHITFYKLAVTAILFSLAAAIAYLVKEKKGAGNVSPRIPDLATLDYYSFRFATFGFTFWSIGMAAGSIWANLSWGRYWGWDVIETWSFMTWLYYGFYLHTRLFLGWQGRKAAWLVIGCFIFSFISAFVIPFIGTISIHSAYFS